MKNLKLLVASLTLSLCSALLGEEEKPAPTMPEVVTLTTGRILKNVQVVRWEKDRVVLKYSGGIDPIAFTLIKEPAPAELTAIRNAAKKAEARINAPANRTVTGQVFVTTRGAGAYKFAGAAVIAFPLAALDSIKSTVEGDIAIERTRMGSRDTLDIDAARYTAWKKAVQNFTPVAEGSTDADGIYRLAVPSKQPVFIYCATYRLAGSSSEYNVWAVPVEKSDRLDLNGSNQL